MARVKSQPQSDEFLRMALVGYQHEVNVINGRIADLRARLGIVKSRDLMARIDAWNNNAAAMIGSNPEPVKAKNGMSEAGRRRVARVMRKRMKLFWAQKKAAEENGGKKKRRMSAAGRLAISRASKARWARYHRERASGPRKMSLATRRKISIAKREAYARRRAAA